MKKLFFILAIAAATTGAFCQPDTTSVSYVAYWSVGDKIRYDDLFPNLLGGEPIRAVARLWFEDVDFEEERSLLVQESKLNPHDTKAFLAEFIARIGIEGAEMEKVLSETVYKIENFNRYDYYYLGVPVKIEFNRNTSINIGKQNNRRFDTTTIELL